MQRKSTRSRSNSPASSIDSSNRRRSSSKKKNPKIIKTKEDVQVFTSLPPKVEGDIKCYLKLQITKINLLTDSNFNEIKNSTVKSNRNQILKSDYNNNNNKLAKPKPDSMIARCIWWGEENSKGALFRPKILGSNSQNLNKIQTTAKYMVRSGPKQFSAYLNDMKTLDIDLIDASTMQIIGKAQLYEIGQLSTTNPIKGFFPAFDSTQVKIAEVYISIQFESLLQDSVEYRKDRSDHSDNSRPVTPTSISNINEFYVKYEDFEKKQQQMSKSQINLFEDNSSNSNLNIFNSHSYKTTIEEDTFSNNKNPIISNLIERGLKLKQEMIKSSNTTLPLMDSNFDSFIHSNIAPIHTSTKNINDYQPVSKGFSNQSIYSLLSSNKNNLYPNEDYSIDDLNDVSRLSDPLHDPNIISALIYDRPNETILKDTNESHLNNDEDQELKNLLEPTNLFNRLAKNTIIDENKITKPVNLIEENKKSNFAKSVTIRNRSLSHSSISSSNISDEDDYSPVKDTSKNISRVSFELQSSDGEGSVCNENCIDVLSPQRISLLNLIQIARLKIDKLGFFTTMSIQNLIDRINKIEKLSHPSVKLTTNSKTKPPIATKRIDYGQLFFIEYQFPVIANSRDHFQNRNNLNSNLMATQVMRVVSKRMKKKDDMTSPDEDTILFDHNADYSVLFNSHLLESWWKSHVSFKIYFRLPTSNSSNSFSSPYLIGNARLSLRNVLKSRNFKLYKKLAVNDQLNDLSNNDLNNKQFKKRIGTLHVSLELSSDLKEFNINLIKLKNSEEKMRSNLKEINNQRKFISSNESLNNNNNNINKLNLEIKGMEISKYEPMSRPISEPTKLNSIEEFSIPIQIYLSINEGRGFTSNINDLSSIYLICRLFWNKEKVKFEPNRSTNTPNDTLFSWTLNLSFMIKPSIIENMRNNYMIIEAWKKPNFNQESRDSLIGTIKLPLHEFYLKTNDLKILKENLNDSNRNPIIGVDGWISAFDPFSGQKTGEINVLLALGSNEQILNLQKILFDKIRIPTNKKSPNKQREHFTEHIFVFKIDNVKIHPIRSLGIKNHAENIEFYIKYSFPSSEKNGIESTKFNSHQISSKLNSKLEHRLILSNDLSIQNELFNLFKKHENCSVIFQIWSKFLNSSKERLIGKGELSIEKINSIISNKDDNLNINNRSFIIPLLLVHDSLIEPNSDYKTDKYIGQLFLTIEYKIDTFFNTLNPNVDQTISLNMPYNNNNNNSNFVTLNISILRANGLKDAINNIINNNNSNLFCLEYSNIYIKFSLNFLNWPYDYKQTRLISSSLCGYTPEFFDYFDIECPLVSKYNSMTKKTISLAEQLETGQIVFEVWSKFLDIYNKNSSDVLLGTCSVSLEPLLENRIGIRGWIPIKTVSQTSFLSALVDEKNVGNIEIAIRFTKSDEYLKVISNSKEIGWVAPHEIGKPTYNNNNMYTDSICNIVDEECRNIEPEHTNQQTITQIQTSILTKKKTKCLIEIEKAIHLPKVYDEKVNSHLEPNAFVSFNINLENLSDTVQTKLCENTCSPIWNYQFMFQVDHEYFLEESKYFMLKVWHKYPSRDDRTTNKILGYVSVDLQPLIYGLTHLNGWYNIQDSVGNCQGQIKINFIPQESLLSIKEAYLKIKKTLNSNYCDKRVSIYNQQKFDSPSQNSLVSFQSLTSSNLTTVNTSSTTLKSATIETCFNETLKDKSQLKQGLLEKLNELDQLNRLLKERLERKNSNNYLKKDIEDKQNYVDITNKIESKNSSEKLVQTESLLSHNNEQKYEENNELEINEINEKLTDRNESDILDNKNDEIHLDENLETNYPFKKDNSIFDSFWASSIASESKSENLFKGGNLETVKSIESEKFEYLPPIAPTEHNNESNNQINDDNVKNCQSDNLNDTDLDQTFNINNSFEIIPNRNSENGSPQIETYDFIDKIIDCSKLENNEDSNEQDLENYDKNKSLLLNDLNQNENYVDDFDLNEDNENLTVVVPEILNKSADEEKPNNYNEDEKKVSDEINQNEDVIAKKEEKTDTNQLSERLKDLSSKIPNYFLPQEDMEKSMKRLHYNYINIKSNDNTGTNSETDESEKNFKIKLKSSTLLIQNQKLLKQDLSRINKIFNSKLN